MIDFILSILLNIWLSVFYDIHPMKFISSILLHPISCSPNPSPVPQVLVFDFGSEVYAWLGKRAGAEDRRVGVALAKELWAEDYDYSDCDINPVQPTANANLPMSGTGWQGTGGVGDIFIEYTFETRFEWRECLIITSFSRTASVVGRVRQADGERGDHRLQGEVPRLAGPRAAGQDQGECAYCRTMAEGFRSRCMK